MQLRSQILLYLSVFALAPLLVALAITMPLIFNQLELFYNEAHLQNLRADFRDLDQHLASRRELTRLLARVPEPGLVLGQQANTTDQAQLETARRLYSTWIDSLIGKQLDVFEAQFVDTSGKAQFWLHRNIMDGALTSEDQPPEAPAALVDAALNAPIDTVLTGRIIIDQENPLLPGGLRAHLAAPIAVVQNQADGTSYYENIGALILAIDVGGLARAYPGTLWAQNSGQYLNYQADDRLSRNAFDDFDGLEALFSNAKVTLWRGPDKGPMMWVPMFQTESSGPLWVGRQVDSSPIAAIKTDTLWRVLGIAVLLMLLALGFARRIANRVDRIGKDLKDGLRDIIESAKPVRFDWQRPQEIADLGDSLSKLALEHAEQTEASQAQAAALRRSNAVKSRFLANVSHELRTPLNSILLLSKVLAGKQSNLSEKQHKQATTINAAGRDLHQLIDNILTQSRMDAGKTDLHCETVELRTLLQQQIAVLEPQFHAKGLLLTLEIDPKMPAAIQTDGGKLAQILKNFLGNALKFTSNGEVRLSAALEEESIVFSVHDSGVGIAQSKLAQIFEPFEQAEGHTNRRYGGTGLGLAISRDLATLLGGSIRVKSIPNKGSTFSLQLPLSAVPSAQLAPKPDSILVPSQPQEVLHTQILSADFDGKRIVVGDDDAIRLLALTRTLEAWHIDVDAAMDGSEILETLHETITAPAAILIDADADDFNTDDLLDKFPRIIGNDVAVIVLSANPLDLPAKVLVKPVSDEQLLEALRECLS